MKAIFTILIILVLIGAGIFAYSYFADFDFLSFISPVTNFFKGLFQ